jgi:hypothetical protein
MNSKAEGQTKWVKVTNAKGLKGHTSQNELRGCKSILMGSTVIEKEMPTADFRVMSAVKAPRDERVG